MCELFVIKHKKCLKKDKTISLFVVESTRHDGRRPAQSLGELT